MQLSHRDILIKSELNQTIFIGYETQNRKFASNFASRNLLFSYHSHILWISYRKEEQWKRIKLPMNVYIFIWEIKNKLSFLLSDIGLVICWFDKAHGFLDPVPMVLWHLQFRFFFWDLFALFENDAVEWDYF